MNTTDKRNFRLGVINGVLYIFSETMLDPTLVLVAFVSQLTNSPILLGLVVPLRDGSWALPQLWVSGFLQTIPRKIDFYRKMSYLRIGSWAALTLGINFIHDRTLLLITFFVAYGCGESSVKIPTPKAGVKPRIRRVMEPPAQAGSVNW
ncbi:MAG TPA: hypothetical protein VHP14_14725 [Anaerolineales bacterium]|nr:hypothetical protein [Anaerolineales bacterium]